MGKSPKKSFKSKSFIGQSFRRLSAKYGDPFQVDDFALEVDEDLSSYPGTHQYSTPNIVFADNEQATRNGSTKRSTNTMRIVFKCKA